MNLLQVFPRTVIGFAVEALTLDDSIWQCYFTDFISHKLDLLHPTLHKPLQEDIAHQLLHAYFEQLHSCEMPQRLVELHCSASLKQLSLARMVTHILCPLRKIKEVRRYNSNILILSSLIKFSCSKSNLTDYLLYL